jgi:hypothetical protein
MRFWKKNDVVQKDEGGIRNAHHEVKLGSIIVQVRVFDPTCLETIRTTWLKLRFESKQRTLPHLRQHLTWPTPSSQEFSVRAHVVILHRLLVSFSRAFESSRKLQKTITVTNCGSECISKQFGELCTHLVWALCRPPRVCLHVQGQAVQAKFLACRFDPEDEFTVIPRIISHC